MRWSLGRPHARTVHTLQAPPIRWEEDESAVQELLNFLEQLMGELENVVQKNKKLMGRVMASQSTTTLSPEGKRVLESGWPLPCRSCPDSIFPPGECLGKTVSLEWDATGNRFVASENQSVKQKARSPVKRRRSEMKDSREQSKERNKPTKESSDYKTLEGTCLELDPTRWVESVFVLGLVVLEKSWKITASPNPLRLSLMLILRAIGKLFQLVQAPLFYFHIIMQYPSWFSVDANEGPSLFQSQKEAEGNILERLAQIEGKCAEHENKQTHSESDERSKPSESLEHFFATSPSGTDTATRLANTVRGLTQPIEDSKQWHEEHAGEEDTFNMYDPIAWPTRREYGYYQAMRTLLEVSTSNNCEVTTMNDVFQTTVLSRAVNIKDDLALPTSLSSSELSSMESLLWDLREKLPAEL